MASWPVSPSVRRIWLAVVPPGWTVSVFHTGPLGCSLSAVSSALLEGAIVVVVVVVVVVVDEDGGGGSVAGGANGANGTTAGGVGLSENWQATGS